MKSKKKSYIHTHTTHIHSKDTSLTLCVQSVRHEFELSIRWNERDRAIILKSCQSHTLMEFNIFKFHGFYF